MSYNHNLLETLVADCNLLRSKNQELINQINTITTQLSNIEDCLKVLRDTQALTNYGSLTGEDINSIIDDLNLEESITDHILTRTDWDDVVKVELSLNGNEIETMVDADRWDIDRYISRDLSSVLEESIREILQNFTKKQEVQNDPI